MFATQWDIISNAIEDEELDAEEINHLLDVINEILLGTAEE